MSRGPGRWQRTILAAVREGWIYLVYVLPDGADRADYVAASASILVREPG